MHIKDQYRRAVMLDEPGKDDACQEGFSGACRAEDA